MTRVPDVVQNAGVRLGCTARARLARCKTVGALSRSVIQVLLIHPTPMAVADIDDESLLQASDLPAAC